MPKRKSPTRRTKSLASEKATAEAVASQAQERGDVTLSIPQTTELCRIPGNALPGVAMYWSYVVRNRQRWAGEVEPLNALKKRATEKLIDLGIRRIRSVRSRRPALLKLPFHLRAKRMDGRRAFFLGSFWSAPPHWLTATAG